MFPVPNPASFDDCDSHPDRRSFMATAARQLLGVSFFAGVNRFGGANPQAAAAAGATGGKAKHIIYLFMDGAMSHLDTFDPKPGTEEGGETKGIATRTPGVFFGENLPRLAYLSGALAIVRSLSTETGAHEQGRYLMRTAYKQLNSIRHPGMGAWMAHVAGRTKKELPDNILIGSDNDHPGAGFLDPALSPVPIANAAYGLKNIKLPSYVTEDSFKRRLQLANKFDHGFRQRYAGSQVEAYNQMYLQARRLMGSSALKVFDIKEEPEAVAEAYGKNALGQGCLLARRLVEQGVGFVEISSGGWDMHQDLYESLEKKGAELDMALSSLLRDLNSKGLLDETLVVLATEFGRTPKINVNAGRDHHPGAFSGLLAGAGIRGGQVYGASDAKGHSVDSDHVSVGAFNATIAAAAGLPTDQDFFAPNGRPFKIGGGAKPVAALLA